MTTKKKRPRYALDDETIEKLEWLCKQHQKRAGATKVYPAHTLKELIDNDYQIRKRFG
ncbi:hypothetical protein [Enterococcus sp. AZ051]|uniref:hypothetical protein n=1 Tax=Enterococcus sp. AZ051 TaxID=2774698 RepID=UPI003D2AFB51